MALLQVRNFPDEVYVQVKAAALHDRRTVAQQAVVLIERALAQGPAPSPGQALADLDALRATMPPDRLDPVAMVRQDRDHR